MNELVTRQPETELAIRDDTKALIVSSVSENMVKGAYPHALLVAKLQEMAIQSERR